MNRKAEIFFDAITLLREDLVEEAQNYIFRKKRSGWRRFGSLAACAVLVVSLGMLAVLPRGCGGAGGSGANSAPPQSADTAPDLSGGAYYGDGSDHNMNGAPPPAPTEEPEAAPADTPGDGLIRFSGHVLKVLEDELLVAPFDSLPEVPALVRVPTAGLGELPEFYLGGVVQVACRGFTLEEGAAVAENVARIDLVEP